MVNKPIIKYEVGKYQDHWRLYIITETYDKTTKMGGCGIDVIMAGLKEACLKKKEELGNEKKSNNKNNSSNN